jgi:hypothetical protein
MHYNLVKIHPSVQTTRAMAAGVTDRLCEIQDLVGLPDARGRHTLMPKTWMRTHANGWRGYVEYVPAFGEANTPGRYVASAIAPDGSPPRASNHATIELAQAAADASVREASGHDRCDCSPWPAVEDS